jgi:hypothetical protein
MSEARQGKEIVLKMKSRVGLLFEVSKLLAEKGVSILAVNGTVHGEECTIRLVTDDGLRTMDALREKDYDPQEANVIFLEVTHKPGMLKQVTDILTRENIYIHYLYATAMDEHDKCLLVLHTVNDEHAIPALNKTPAGAAAG